MPSNHLPIRCARVNRSSLEFGWQYRPEECPEKQHIVDTLLCINKLTNICLVPLQALLSMSGPELLYLEIGPAYTCEAITATVEMEHIADTNNDGGSLLSCLQGFRSQGSAPIHCTPR